MAKQKHHTPTFKVQVVLEMRKEEKTVTQIAAEYPMHPGQLHRWKRQALDNFPHLFTESQALTSSRPTPMNSKSPSCCSASFPLAVMA